MLKPVRRVVTGLNTKGESAVVFDGPASVQMENPAWPGSGIAFLWATSETPASNAGNVDAAVALSHQVMAPPHGTGFVFWQCPPLSELANMSPEQRAKAQGTDMIKTSGTDKSRHPGMHATDTLDYAVVLSGELTLILEDGEVVLRAGDTVVDRGVMHAWENRGTETAYCVFINIGAQPLKSA